MRVHELAKELGCSSKELLGRLHALDVEAKSHMSALDDTAVELMREDMGSAKKTPEAEKVKKVEKVEKVEGVAKAEEAKKGKEVGEASADLPAKEDADQRSTVDGKIIKVHGAVVVKELADLLGLKPNEVIAELMGMNVLAAINQRVEVNVARKIAEKHGFSLEQEKRLEEHRQMQKKRLPDEEEEEDRAEDLVMRPPVVTFLGHVDHGKTSLLDRIRDTKVVSGEAGGITQHIGASTVDVGGRTITFLDTPGHEAFTAMRARGANLTDIAVIVIAADDGIMPQTKEAIKHAQAAGVTLMVAINKIDLDTANPDMVKQQLQAEDMTPEDWGGELICVPVSAQTGEGIDHLLEMIILQADMMDLKGSPKRKARGFVIEAQLEPGRGPTANLLVTMGTLKVGDVILCGKHCGKVRALISDDGRKVKSVAPAMPAKCLGLSGVPEAGGEFRVYSSDKLARSMAAEQAEKDRAQQQTPIKKASLDDLFSDIEAIDQIQLKVIIKADTQGSIEAIEHSLKDIESEKVLLDIIFSGTGNVTINDVMLASASNAVVLGFHVGREPGVDAAARHEGVDIRLHQVIYELIDEVRDAMAGLLSPEVHETVKGHAEIRQVFSMGKSAAVAGCFVTDGSVSCTDRVRVQREDEVLFEGSLSSLKRYQDDVKQVREGLECGIRIANYTSFAEGDLLEFYEVEERKQTL